VLGIRWEAEGVAAELFGDEVPAEGCVVRGAVHVAMAALDWFCVQHGAGPAPFEEPVDGTDAEPRDEGFVSTVAEPIQLRERLAPRRSVEDLLDVLPV